MLDCGANMGKLGKSSTPADLPRVSTTVSPGKTGSNFDMAEPSISGPTRRPRSFRKRTVKFGSRAGAGIQNRRNPLSRRDFDRLANDRRRPVVVGDFDLDRAGEAFVTALDLDPYGRPSADLEAVAALDAAETDPEVCDLGMGRSQEERAEGQDQRSEPSRRRRGRRSSPHGRGFLEVRSHHGFTDGSH